MVKRYANAEIRNNTERFRYQSLTARYTTFNELWQKRLRAREEGKAFGVHGLKADELPLPPPPASPASRDAGRAAAPKAEYRVADPARDGAAVRALYQRFVDERVRAGEGAAPSFESFQQLIAKQTSRILSEKGARAVDFRLESRDGKVSLKARLVK
jgi:histidinol-phosphate/aromatic aminotransferase/cobyric acid decarboxylase-like protein